MIVKRFKNGNFNVKAEAGELTGSGSYLERDGLELIIDLCNSSELDFMPAGDEGCFGNFDMYYPLYNAYTDMLYLPTGSDCHKYRQGKAVKLYGRPLDQDEREELTDIIGGLEK